MNNFTIIHRLSGQQLHDLARLKTVLDAWNCWMGTAIPGLYALPVHSPDPLAAQSIAKFCDNVDNIKQNGFTLAETWIDWLSAFTGKHTLGRSNFSRLDVGSQFPLHTDQGNSIVGYTRYHITIHNAGAEFHSGDEVLVASTGDVFSFNNHLPHKVVNNGTDVRYTLAIDLK